ncbi:MAG: hypothetical protein Kow0069_22170 [Promethearchaeota archaeon]
MDDVSRLALTSLAVVGAQSAIKLAGVAITSSLGFLAEAVDTFVDVGFVALTAYGARAGRKPADWEHQWGHAKVEVLTSLVQGLVLLNLYAVLLFNALRVFFGGAAVGVRNVGAGAVLLAASIVTNGFFSTYLVRRGRARGSPAIVMQGLNLRGDFFRAFVVVGSLAWAGLGFSQVDPLAGAVVSAWVLADSARETRRSVVDLLDVNPLTHLQVRGLEMTLSSIPHVRRVARLRARRVGRELLLEVALVVERGVLVSQVQSVELAARAACRTLLGSDSVDLVLSVTPAESGDNLQEITNDLATLVGEVVAHHDELLRFRDLGVLRVPDGLILSLTLVVDAALTLDEAHDLCTHFEREVMDATGVFRVTTHLEGEAVEPPPAYSGQSPSCGTPEQLEDLRKQVEGVLRGFPEVEGYHGLECWMLPDGWVFGLHVFLDGSLNVATAHDLLCEVERRLKGTLPGGTRATYVLHPEPVKGRSDGVRF